MTENSKAEKIRELIALMENTDKGGWQLNVAIHRLQNANAALAFESSVFVDSNDEGFYFGPSYTQKIDDAMSLIPPGWSAIEITTENNSYNVKITNSDNPSLSNIGTGSTLPLAISIAGLKITEANI
ncbi:MAG: hypothetical protein D6B27_11170 [Gammaproteobacteria bacterium]|nr:MAG: hypothetical protein D6B27_11170 [Gammaproteobacteria bacterium]